MKPRLGSIDRYLPSQDGAQPQAQPSHLSSAFCLSPVLAHKVLTRPVLSPRLRSPVYAEGPPPALTLGSSLSLPSDEPHDPSHACHNKAGTVGTLRCPFHSKAPEARREARLLEAALLGSGSGCALIFRVPTATHVPGGESEERGGGGGTAQREPWARPWVGLALLWPPPAGCPHPPPGRLLKPRAPRGSRTGRQLPHLRGRCLWQIPGALPLA